jgi:hypothetical protein
MAIGDGWEEGSWIDASWIAGAWKVGADIIVEIGNVWRKGVMSVKGYICYRR